jgi:rare lipoprotein A
MERPAPHRRMPRTAVLVIAAVALAAAACAPARRPVREGAVARWDEVGLASWYGARFRGRPTASGEPFDPDALTAAHRTLPFGTRVEVARLDTGRRVVVEINDRGPWIDGRIVDLSRAAARRLDMIDAGVVEVGLRVLE